MTTGPYTKQRQRYLVAERDRLHAVNTQLLKALEWAIAYCPAKGYGGKAYLETYNQARAAIELAKGK